MARSTLSDVNDALVQIGFNHVLTGANGNLTYQGQLTTSIGLISIELKLKTLGELPSIRLLEIPKQLKPLSPHIGSDGSICYASQGSIALDIFDPAGQVLACLDRATEVFNQIVSGERVLDLSEEFFAYWSGSLCLLDLKKFQSQDAFAAILTTPKGTDSELFVISEDLEHTKIKLAAFGYAMRSLSCAVCVVTTTAEPLPALDFWPPQSVRELLSWQRKLDSNCARKLQKRLQDVAQRGYENVIVLFVSPTSHYAAAILFSDAMIAKSYKKHGNILTDLYSSKISQLSSMRIDDLHITERNQPARTTLIGKKIILIGCGTIGGYLAELLMKSGAGLQGGQLVLVDTDNIAPGNLGRHKLGFNTLFQNKASALASELIRSMPTANIVSNTLDARQLHFMPFDLIINSTGEQSLSDELSAKINKNERSFRPILHCWIEGSGVAVRSMLQDQYGKACYRCLSSENRVAIYPATTEPYTVKMGGHGCENLFVSFSATASVFAAALAVEHVMDWANGHPQPRLRTVVLDRTFKSDHLNAEPVKQHYCPACAS
ncbi:MAG: ThiF family adenylyltransferase [Gallionella sp.]|nr:ThiF family adenylyltransferase [Gallionella sp.]MDD4959467.1 ThiF family adenylyltransferase [Gallionella sp.]